MAVRTLDGDGGGAGLDAPAALADVVALPAPGGGRGGGRLTPGRLAVYLALVAGGVVMVLPLAWMTSAAFKPLEEVMRIPPTWIPESPTLDNFRAVFRQFPFPRYVLNSLIVAVVVVFSTLATSTLAGYALAKFEFPGRSLIFGAILASLMIPFQVRMIPLYQMIIRLHWQDTLQGMMVPWLVDAFGIFLMRQFIRVIPNELLDAARMDGASEPRVFWQIVLPLTRPALAALAIFTFLGNWEEFLWPLIVSSSDGSRTLPVGLQTFAEQYGTNTNYQMAGAMIATIPVLVLFFLLQKQFIEGITLSGMKGVAGEPMTDARPRLMTPAPTLDALPNSIPTGNLAVSLPSISRADGSIDRIGVLHMRANALVELVGDGEGGRPLLRPVLRRDGVDLPLGPLAWERVAHWLPRFRVEAGGVRLTGTIVAPPGERGFVYLLEVESAGAEGETAGLQLGLEGFWQGVEATVFTSRPLAVETTLALDPWTGSLVGEASAGLPLIAWGMQASRAGELSVDGSSYRWLCDAAPGKGDATRVTFFVSVAPEGDGARTGALHLRRRGEDALHAATLAWLGRRAIPCDDPTLRRVMNENALFNYHFAQGDCLDTDEVALVTSRSPHYYVSGAYWARDAFLWSFPALLLVDRDRAREALLAGLGRYLRWAGHHALYLNGTVLYPGFELDEACAPAIGLGLYLARTGDVGVLEEPSVRAALPALHRALDEWRDPATGLYATFLTPHDDPVGAPFLTYDNVLVWRALLVLAECADLFGNDTPAAERRREADRLRAAILRHCVAEGPFGRQWACAVDGEGAFELEEQPGGSLSLLPYYGFCSEDDPIQVATVRWIRSGHNPYHYAGPFGGVGSPHFEFPSIFDLAARLLRGDPEALRTAATIPLDDGLACESFDPGTGVARTGAAFATAAGLLAFALAEATGAAPAGPFAYLGDGSAGEDGGSVGDEAPPADAVAG